MPIATINPATNETLKNFSDLTSSEIDSKIDLSRRTFLSYRNTTFDERGARLLKVADLLERRKDELARTIVLEMGKPLQSAVDEVVKCASACRFYATEAKSLLARRKIETRATESYVIHQPLGPILAIMPWNFPFWQAFRAIAPALMAGNTMLLKHASNVPQSALAIESVILEAGFAKGVLQTLLVNSKQVSRIIESEHVKGVTLTGSEKAGSEVAALASKLIKPCVLELGGSDPFVVMPSADLKKAVEMAIRSRTISNGQSCIAAKRFIVHVRIAEEFTRLFADGMKALVIGDPLKPETQIGPLATTSILEELEGQVTRTLQQGAKLVTGGKRAKPAGLNGNFYEPTVITNIDRKSPLHEEEVFGPVAAVFVVKDFEEAMTVANDTRFGLGSSIWTQDPTEQNRAIQELEAGQVFVNAIVASDPHLPFGGIKNSGFGRELGTPGIVAFVNQKTVWIQ
ncbi:MAG: NAD-dependent succinate-semialdehyde dehydrogenase [Methylotenera sp.]|nr:NAD-dependent succinate-semialdehyde dehydrogenase [Oligoflexia bacterium]